VCGDKHLGEKVERIRDKHVYEGDVPYDFNQALGLRQKQIKELTKEGIFNAKYSKGGLVDIEYYIQALQMIYGGEFKELRVTNTLLAMERLEERKLLTKSVNYEDLRNSYLFLKRLVDACRVLAGDAKALDIPENRNSAEFLFLSRRMKYNCASDFENARMKWCTIAANAYIELITIQGSM